MPPGPCQQEELKQASPEPAPDERYRCNSLCLYRFLVSLKLLLIPECLPVHPGIVAKAPSLQQSDQAIRGLITDTINSIISEPAIGQLSDLELKSARLLQN